jgi:hypothetical protein
MLCVVTRPIMLSVVMPSVIMLNVIMPSVIMLNVKMLSVVAPFSVINDGKVSLSKQLRCHK